MAREKPGVREGGRYERGGYEERHHRGGEGVEIVGGLLKKMCENRAGLPSKSTVGLEKRGKINFK